MRPSLILSLYIGRQFLLTLLSVLFILASLVTLIDGVELLRRAATRPDVGMGVVLTMTLLKQPDMIQRMMPFAMLFGGMITFWRMTRSHELTVVRAAGISVWQFLLPALTVATVLGLLQISVFNPLASLTLGRYEQLEARHLRGSQSFLKLSKAGLWLRQADRSGQSVIHAAHAVSSGANLEMTDVIIFEFEGADHFLRRIDAAKARLDDGQWNLEDAWVLAPDAMPRHQAHLRVPTELTLETIEDSFSSPSTMSFWTLPGFIRTLENAGFSAVRHRMYLNSLLAAPLLFSAMVLIAATFSLRQHRRGGTVQLVIGGIAVGFLFHFFSDVVMALGLSQIIPIALAAWTPAGISTLLGVATLLHLEDG